jgi:hypothetical protein
MLSSLRGRLFTHIVQTLEADDDDDSDHRNTTDAAPAGRWARVRERFLTVFSSSSASGRRASGGGGGSGGSGGGRSRSRDEMVSLLMDLHEDLLTQVSLEMSPEMSPEMSRGGRVLGSHGGVRVATAPPLSTMHALTCAPAHPARAAA